MRSHIKKLMGMHLPNQQEGPHPRHHQPKGVVGLLRPVQGTLSNARHHDREHEMAHPHDMAQGGHHPNMGTSVTLRAALDCATWTA